MSSCDGGSVVLQRLGEASVHEYIGAPEPQLVEIVARPGQLRDALDTCVSTDAVEFDGVCDR